MQERHCIDSHYRAVLLMPIQEMKGCAFFLYFLIYIDYVLSVPTVSYLVSADMCFSLMTFFQAIYEIERAIDHILYARYNYMKCRNYVPLIILHLA